MPQAARLHALSPTRRCRALAAISATVLFLAFPLAAAPQEAQREPGAQEAGDSADWAGSFERLYETLKEQYPFTVWKGLDWDAMASRPRAMIADAVATRDEGEFYRAVREFVHAIPDRHVKLRGTPPDDFFAPVAGALGFDLGLTTDNRVIITRSSNDALPPGSEIVTWNGVEAFSALQATSPVFADGPAGALEAHRREQLRFLSRVPVGDVVRLQVRDGNATRTFEVASRNDDFAGLEESRFYVADEERSTPVTFHLRDDGIGYLKVTVMAHPDVHVARAIGTDFATALGEFNAAGARGLIVDLRHNAGGSDELTAELAGHFYRRRVHYLSAEYYDEATGDFLVADDEVIFIEPREPYFGGPIVVLVSSGTVSAGEGLAEAIQRLPRGMAVGMYTSNGSYGMTGGRLELPGGWRVSFPSGRAVDPDGVILLDGDAVGHGGVVPDVRVPRSKANLLRMAAGADVELEWALGALRMLCEHR